MIQAILIRLTTTTFYNIMLHYCITAVISFVIYITESHYTQYKPTAGPVIVAITTLHPLSIPKAEKVEGILCYKCNVAHEATLY